MKKIGYTIMIIGIVLLLAALSIFIYNKVESRTAYEKATHYLTIIKGQIEKEDETKSFEQTESFEETLEDTGKEDVSKEDTIKQLRVVTIDGFDYIGYLSVPSCNIELPVQAELTYDLLKTSPCRFHGSPYEGNFIIGGHSYDQFFVPLYDIEIGAEATFTDLDGVSTTYQVEAIDIIAQNGLEDLVNNPFDMTLFTCTFDAQSRFTVRLRQIH